MLKVRFAVNPCCNEYRNASMWGLRPTNSSGLAGKFGLGGPYGEGEGLRGIYGLSVGVGGS